MLFYARSDTHFLLYIYDHLRNALLSRPASSPPATSLLHQVLSRSEKTALRTYDREPYDVEEGDGPCGWSTLALKWNRKALVFKEFYPEFRGSEVEGEVYRAVHQWRDSVSREEDESTGYAHPPS
jgi:exosome complex exonuclease RRP6